MTCHEGDNEAGTGGRYSSARVAVLARWSIGDTFERRGVRNCAQHVIAEACLPMRKPVMPRAARSSSETPLPVRGRLAVAAALTFAAGVVHVAAAVPHFGDDTLLGSAFAITGWLQILIAALLLRHRPVHATVWAGVLAHLGALGALVAARTVGLPLGHGGVEPITFPDTTTAVLEVAALVVLAGWLRWPHRLGMPRPVVLGMLGVAGLFAMGGSTLAVAALGTSGHGHAEEAGGHADGGMDGDQQIAGSDDEEVHLHGDDSVHVHAGGQAHEHGDGTVHVHLAQASQQAPQNNTDSESHTHAPGEDHD